MLDSIENNLETIEEIIEVIFGYVKNMREFGGDSDGSDA